MHRHMYLGRELWRVSSRRRLSWDLKCLTPSLIRAVIILCTGPDNPTNEVDCETKKISCPWRVLCWSPNHRTRQHVLALSSPSFQHDLILHIWMSSPPNYSRESNCSILIQAIQSNKCLLYWRLNNHSSSSSEMEQEIET